MQTIEQVYTYEILTKDQSDLKDNSSLSIIPEIVADRTYIIAREL